MTPVLDTVTAMRPPWHAACLMLAPPQSLPQHPRPSKPIPIVTPVLDALQRFAMPRTLPDGRTEVRLPAALWVTLGRA